MTNSLHKVQHVCICIKGCFDQSPENNKPFLLSWTILWYSFLRPGIAAFLAPGWTTLPMYQDNQNYSARIPLQLFYASSPPPFFEIQLDTYALA